MEECPGVISSAWVTMCLAMLSSLLRPAIFGLLSLGLGIINDWAVVFLFCVKGFLKPLSRSYRLMLLGVLNWKGRIGGLYDSEEGEKMTDDAMYLFLLGG